MAVSVGLTAAFVRKTAYEQLPEMSNTQNFQDRMDGHNDHGDSSHIHKDSKKISAPETDTKGGVIPKSVYNKPPNAIMNSQASGSNGQSPNKGGASPLKQGLQLGGNSGFSGFASGEANYQQPNQSDFRIDGRPYN